MKTISFRISDNFYDKLIDLKVWWNEKDHKCRDYKPYTTTDIINMCIGILWEIETNNSQNISLTNKSKTANIKE